VAPKFEALYFIHVESKMGAVALGFDGTWKPFRAAASVQLNLTPFPIPQYVVVAS